MSDPEPQRCRECSMPLSRDEVRHGDGLCVACWWHTKPQQDMPPDEVVAIMAKAWHYTEDFTRTVLAGVKSDHPDAHIYFDLEWVTRALRAEADNAQLIDSLRRLSNEAAGMLGYGGQALRELLGNTNFAVLESKINDARVVLKITEPDKTSTHADKC